MGGRVRCPAAREGRVGDEEDAGWFFVQVWVSWSASEWVGFLFLGVGGQRRIMVVKLELRVLCSSMLPRMRYAVTADPCDILSYRRHLPGTQVPQTIASLLLTR